MTIDVGQRAEPVMFDLEEPIRMNGPGMRTSGIGLITGTIQRTGTVGLASS
jgi:hypothetical protein